MVASNYIFERFGFLERDVSWVKLVQHPTPVGSLSRIGARWGHANLADGMIEWMLDSGPILPGTCNDCANVALGWLMYPLPL